MDEKKLIIIDDMAVIYSDEKTIFEVCEKHAIKIPQMCFKRELTPCGSCGLCTVELFDESVGGQWFPVLACAIAPSKGLRIRTNSERISAIRELAGRLMLRSHPCDCDDCEKFGNCALRKIYNKTGFGFTRAIEDGKKNKPLIATISERFLLDREKCTHCGLCVTFFREELGEDFLHLACRDGEHVRLERYPQVKYHEGYLLNAIEICPCNAIMDLESGSVLPSWKMKSVNGISTESSTGNNVKILVSGDEITDIKPRPNPRISDYIPDCVRDLHKNNKIDRVDEIILHGQKMEIRESMIFLQSKIGFGHRCAVICSGSISLEGMLLSRQLADVLGAKIFVKNHPRAGDAWLISNDADANIRGALVTQALKGRAVDDFSEVESLIENKQIHTLIILNEDILAEGFSEKLFSSVYTLSFSSHKNKTTQKSHLVVPICTVFEEDGHFINKDFLLQRFHRAVERKTRAQPIWQWLAMVKNIYTGRIGEASEFQRIEDVWRFLTKFIPEFENVNFATIPPDGTLLENVRFKDYPFLA